MLLTSFLAWRVDMSQGLGECQRRWYLSCSCHCIRQWWVLGNVTSCHCYATQTQETTQKSFTVCFFLVSLSLSLYSLPLSFCVSILVCFLCGSIWVGWLCMCVCVCVFVSVLLSASLYVYLWLWRWSTRVSVSKSFCLCLFVPLPLSLYLSISILFPLCLSVSLFLFLFISVSPSLWVSLCLSVSVSPTRSSPQKPGMTQKTVTVHYRENIEQSLFAHARSLTTGANNEKFRINWVLIICQGKKWWDIYETKDNLATVKTSARSNKSNPNEAWQGQREAGSQPLCTKRKENKC